MKKTFGTQLEQSELIQGKITDLVNESLKFNQRISGVKAADSELEKEYQDWITDLEGNRGRPLFYKYIGSGLGSGCYVELEDGSVKLDLINGIGINLMGHSHPEVMKAAVMGALQDVVVQGNLQPGKEMVRFTKKIVELSTRKSRMNHAWITTSGSMSNENALKMCRQKMNGARKIIAMSAAFAGRTTMMAEVTDNDSMRVGLPRYDEILRIPFYDKNNPNSIDETAQLFKKHLEDHKGNICAFIFEPMQGEGGYNVAPREYFIPLLEMAKAEGIPVWADEIQTFARTGEFFAYETLDIGDYIDVCTVAKTIQNGCTLYTDELNPQPGLIAGTFAGTAAGLSAGLRILEIMDDGTYVGQGGKVQRIHNEFVGMLNELNESSCKGLLNDAGGMGLMVAVTPFDGSAEKRNALATTLYKNGLICFGCGRGPMRLRFLIPAVMTSEDIQVAKKIIETSVLEMA